MKDFIEHIASYAPLSAAAQESLPDYFEEINFFKNDFLLREGQVCRHLYFVKQGALRGYFNSEGKEITHWFSFENDFATSFYSFTTGKTAVENIQFIENAQLLAVSKEKLAELFNRFPETERLVRIIYEKYYIRLEERFVNGKFKSAAERYENLLLHTPHILSRVPLGYVAAYLGITQETLSRIRSSFNK